MIFAQIILGFALGVMISARFGIGGVDAILFRITEVTSLKYQTLKVVIDVLYTVFGVMMGGVIGLGSLVSVVTTGYLVFGPLLTFSLLAVTNPVEKSNL
jgi:uncharacterized membrane protein YczE